jgi:hypothetical protein
MQLWNPWHTTIQDCKTCDTDKIDAEMQSKYRSRVGMFLYLIKYLRPDLANAVRELSKFMDGASLATYKEMQRIIKFVLDTKLHCLKLQPKHEVKMGFSLVL